MTVTTHPFAPEEIMALLDGELSAVRAQSVFEHIELCAECQVVKNTIQGTSQKMAEWNVDLPQHLEAHAFLSGTVNAASKAKVLGRFSRLLGILSRRWIWAPALSFVIFLFAFGVLFPNLFLAHKVAAPTNASATRRVSTLGVNPYVQSKAGGSAIRQGSVSMDKAGIGSSSNSIEEKELVEDSDRLTHFDSTKLSPPASGSLGKLQSQVGDKPHFPMIARSVALSLVVKDFDASRVSLDAVLARHNGYAAGLNVATPQGAARTLQASLRIPAPQLMGALSALKALGRIENETQNGEEVTQQHADLVARLKNSRETEQRLQDVLRTRTGKVKDVLEVEQEIARVRGEIEQMEAEQKTLEHRVDFASVDLRIAEEYKAQLTSPAPSVGMQLRNATVNGFRTVSESLLAVVLFFAETAPSLLLWFVIVFFPARLLWRRYQRAHALGSSLGV